jgi:hypothetical protein
MAEAFELDEPSHQAVTPKAHLSLPQVSIGFSPSQQLPGGDVELQLQAAPGSLCAIRAVDESVLLLRPERELCAWSAAGAG